MVDRGKQSPACRGAKSIAAGTAYIVRDGVAVPLPEPGAVPGDERYLNITYVVEAAYHHPLGRPASVVTDADAYHYDRGVWAGMVLAYAHLIGHHTQTDPRRPLPGGTSAVRAMLLGLTTGQESTADGTLSRRTGLRGKRRQKALATLPHLMDKSDGLSLSAKLADILARYDLSGPTEEISATGQNRCIYLLTNLDQPMETRRVVHEFGPDEDVWYAEDVPFYARHKTAYYAEAVKRAVTNDPRLPHTGRCNE